MGVCINGMADVHSQPVQGSKTTGFSHVYRNSGHMKELLKFNTKYANLKQLYVQAYLKKFASNPCLGKIKVTKHEQNNQVQQTRQIQRTFTYKEVFDMASHLGSGLLNLNLSYLTDDKDLNLIGIYSKNRYEFNISDLACSLYGLTSVPLYETLGVENLVFCLDQTKMTTVICSGQLAASLNKLTKTSNLKNLVLLDTVAQDLRKDLSKKYRLYQFEQIIQSGKRDTVDYNKVQVNSQKCFTFCYTSGTTGFPKGAMLSHKNFLSFLAGYQDHLKDYPINQKDVYLSMLPMPHVFQRVVVTHLFSVGAFVVPYSGNLLKIKQDIMLVKPTYLASVPRLYNRFVQGICEKLGGQQNVRSLIQSKSDILAKVREGFGGKVRLMVTGSASITAKTQRMLQGIMNCPFIQGYGQTECTAGAFIQKVEDRQYGFLGTIIGNLQFKLADIEQMNYTSDDKDQYGNLTPRGQIWLRGQAVIQGYYKDSEKTRQAITQDGWLKTGDVGVLQTSMNRLKIIDRKKNIFKLQQGEYVACEKVQAIYLKNKYVSQAFLHGQSIQNFAVAILSINKPQVEKLCKQLGLKGTLSENCQSKELINKIFMQIHEIGQKQGLKGFQQAKNIRLEPDGFALKGLVSSTMKLQRFKAKQFYKKQISQMYSQGMLKTK